MDKSEPDHTQYDWCSNCGGINCLLKEICCRCGWNERGNRLGTDEEIKETTIEMDKAIKELKNVLGLRG